MADRDKPNIVFMLADNVGWGDLACYGGTVPTPRLDALASEGMRFNNYNTEAQCTPTRSAILTGRMPVRMGTYRVPLPGEGLEYGLAPWEYTLAELLSDAGYATALFGKWHCGEASGRLPIDQGFDQWWGIKNTSDESAYAAHPLYPDEFERPMIWEGEKGSEATPVDEFTIESRTFIDEGIATRSIDFIRRNAEAATPFFLFASFTNVHPPMRAHPDFDGVTGSRKAFPANIAELDYRAGQILDTLEELGVAGDTIVVWNSDNASGQLLGEAGGSSGAWRGSFGGGWEGSIRAPAIARWPGHIPAGVVTNEIVAAYDWMPTLASLAEEAGRMPVDRPIDGINVADHLTGKTENSGRDSFMLFGTDGELIAVKWKTLKVHFRYADPGPLWGPYVKPQIPKVYDLVSDPQEKIDLMEADLEHGWAIGAALGPVGELRRSTAQFRNIEPGEHFEGYE